MPSYLQTCICVHVWLVIIDESSTVRLMTSASIAKLPMEKHKNNVFTNFRQVKGAHMLICST